MKLHRKLNNIMVNYFMSSEVINLSRPEAEMLMHKLLAEQDKESFNLAVHTTLESLGLPEEPLSKLIKAHNKI